MLTAKEEKEDTNIMIEQPDYSSLLANNPDYFPSWESYYNSNLSYPENILNLVRKATVLPYDFSKIITVYALIPTALARRVPYLFFYGASGSGKSTFGKLIAKIHGVEPISSSTTYAAIRNQLKLSKTKWISVPSSDPNKPPMTKQVDANTIIIWEDVDESTFRKNPNIYVLFKVGYDKSTDVIMISGKEPGTLEKFKCFSTKVFSSIHPIHTMDDYKELRRRLIVIPTKKLDNIEVELLDIDGINWKGFSSLFNEFWSIQQAEIFLITRNSLNHLKGLNLQEKAICLDLIATGVSTGIWSDENEAVAELKECFNWLKQDVVSEASDIEKLIKELMSEVEATAKKTKTVPCIATNQLKILVQTWSEKGWLLSKPSNDTVAKAMNKQGYKTNCKGQWMKQQTA